MGGSGARVQGVNFKRGGVTNQNVHIFIYSIHVIVFKSFSNFTQIYWVFPLQLGSRQCSPLILTGVARILSHEGGITDIEVLQVSLVLFSILKMFFSNAVCLTFVFVCNTGSVAS